MSRAAQVGREQGGLRWVLKDETDGCHVEKTHSMLKTTLLWVDLCSPKKIYSSPDSYYLRSYLKIGSLQIQLKCQSGVLEKGGPLIQCDRYPYKKSGKTDRDSQSCDKRRRDRSDGSTSQPTLRGDWSDRSTSQPTLRRDRSAGSTSRPTLRIEVTPEAKRKARKRPSPVPPGPSQGAGPCPHLDRRLPAPRLPAPGTV